MVNFVSEINLKADDVYTWHQNFGAHERLTPPWSGRRLLRQEQSAEHTIQVEKTRFGISSEKIRLNDKKRAIISEKVFSSQQKTHHIRNFNQLNEKTIINENISINLFNTLLPQFIVEPLIKNKLEKEFNFRGKRIENDIKQHQKFEDFGRKNIAILGMDNNHAAEFKPFFTSGNHTVFSFVKRKPYKTAREIQLNTNNNNVGLASLKNINSVIYFPLDDKTNITDQNLEKVLSDKLKELNLLMKSFSVNKTFPESFIMMSSTCVYKNLDMGASELNPTESSSAIATFYNKIEQELKKLSACGTRVVYARTGNILSAKSGILKEEISRQKNTFCRKYFDNNDYLNWVSLDDAIYATNHILFDETIFGATNVCSSMSLRTNDLSLLVASKINRPILLALPAFLFNLFNNNSKHDIISQNNPALPQKLQTSGFKFSFDNIDTALNWETGNIQNYYNKMY